MVVAMLGMAFTAYAQEEKENVAPATDAIAKITLANELAKYGYENSSALALIQAAEILAEIETQDLVFESYEAGEGSQEAKVSAKPEFTAANLIASAKELAKGDKHLMALANKVKVQASNNRGLVGGPGRTVSRVLANSTDTYVLAFRGGEVAEIAVSGDGDTDLDLYVYDQNGNLIVCDTDYSDDCYVCWVPAWTGNFVIKIKNRGNVYNQYVMLTN